QKVQGVQSTEAVSLVLPPSLYLGPCSAASNKAFLAANSITHVLSVGSTPAQKVEGVTYFRLSLNDSPTSSITKVSEEACKIIENAIASKSKGCGKGKILVHCSAGISRSPTLVVAYLMRSHKMSLKAALGQVVRARPQVSPNSGFLEQLKRLEEELFGNVTLDIDELPKREKDRLALFEDDVRSEGEGKPQGD
ncbi:DSPc-domain-containing protein, partial [Obba rivulosa]